MMLHLGYFPFYLRVQTIWDGYVSQYLRLLVVELFDSILCLPSLVPLGFVDILCRKYWFVALVSRLDTMFRWTGSIHALKIFNLELIETVFLCQMTFLNMLNVAVALVIFYSSSMSIFLSLNILQFKYVNLSVISTFWFLITMLGSGGYISFCFITFPFESVSNSSIDIMTVFFILIVKPYFCVTVSNVRIDFSRVAKRHQIICIYQYQNIK